MLDLVLKYDTPDQTIVRTEWSVLGGGDKRGTPLIGTGVFRSLNMEWQACDPDENSGGILSFRTARGSTARLELAYTEPRQLPGQAEPPIESSRGEATAK